MNAVDLFVSRLLFLHQLTVALVTVAVELSSLALQKYFVYPSNIFFLTVCP